MQIKVCVDCNTEKIFDIFHNNHWECKQCKQCNIKGILKSYYENKDKLSNQRKLYYEKNRDV